MAKDGVTDLSMNKYLFRFTGVYSRAKIQFSIFSLESVQKNDKFHGYVDSFTSKDKTTFR